MKKQAASNGLSQTTTLFVSSVYNVRMCVGAKVGMGVARYGRKLDVLSFRNRQGCRPGKIMVSGWSIRPFNKRSIEFSKFQYTASA